VKKIPSLFVRSHHENHRLLDELAPGNGWVIAGEGIATVKYDGTACRVQDGRLWKRCVLGPDDPTPAGWEPAEPDPDPGSGRWPGWLPVGDGAEDRGHREAFEAENGELADGTYELVGPTVRANPYDLDQHYLLRHGDSWYPPGVVPVGFEELAEWFASWGYDPEFGFAVEGIVWHHPDGRKAKVKRSDFGLPWPPPESEER
jgi:hypothetical protein